MKYLKLAGIAALALTLIIVGSFYYPKPQYASATTGPQIFYGRNTDASPVTTSHRIPLNGVAAATSFATTTNGIFPLAGTLSNLRVDVDNAPGGATSWVATVLEGISTNTGITCTITSAITTCNDDSDTFTTTPGKVYHVQVVATGGTPSATYIRVSIKFTPTTSGHTVVMGTGSGGSATLERYQPLTLGIGVNTENVRQNIFPESGTFQNLYAEMSAAPGAGASYTLTLRDNSATSSLTCTASGTTQPCNDTTHTDSFTANNLVDMAIMPSQGTTPAVANPSFGVDFVPNTSGDYIYNSFSQSADSAATVSYYPIAGTLMSATEASTTMIARAMTVTGIAVNVGTNPGAAASGKTRVFTVRKNGADTGITCTVVETSHTCSGSGSVSFADGDTIDISDTPNSATASAANSIAIIANTNTGGGGGGGTTPTNNSSAWFEVLN